MKKDEELSLTTFCQSMKGEIYWEIKSGAQDASRQYTHLLSRLLQVPFLLQVEILIKVRRFFGRREKMEGELGDGSHITSALSESGVGCAAPGNPWRGTGRSWGDLLHLEMVPRTDHFRWLLCDCRFGWDWRPKSEMDKVRCVNPGIIIILHRVINSMHGDTKGEAPAHT